jgi:hypothetical protein
MFTRKEKIHFAVGFLPTTIKWIYFFIIIRPIRPETRQAGPMTNNKPVTSGCHFNCNPDTARIESIAPMPVIMIITINLSILFDFVIASILIFFIVKIIYLFIVMFSQSPQRN